MSLLRLRLCIFIIIEQSNQSVAASRRSAAFAETLSLPGFYTACGYIRAMLYCVYGTSLSNHHSRTAQPVRSGQRHCLFRSHAGQDAAGGGGKTARGLAGGERHDPEDEFRLALLQVSPH